MEALVVWQKQNRLCCSECGADYRKWQGQCSECNAWNTLTEVRLGSGSAGSKSSRMGFAGDVSGKVAPLADIALEEILDWARAWVN